MGHKHRRKNRRKNRGEPRRIDPMTEGTPFEDTSFVSVTNPDGSTIEFSSGDLQVKIDRDYIDVTAFPNTGKTYLAGKRKFTISGTVF